MPIKGAVPFLLACGFEDKVLPVQGILLLWYPETVSVVRSQSEKEALKTFEELSLRLPTCNLI